MPYIGVSPQFGVRRKHTYTATAGQTSFSGAGSEGATLSYTDSNFVDVYQNGVKLGDADYTSTSGTAIVLAQGASVDDLIEIIVFDAFSAADTVSKADGGTFDGNVTMAGTLGVTGATTLSSNLSVDGGTIKLDGNYPTGNFNVAIGDTALDSITDGSGNVAIGHATATALTSGTLNTAIGYIAFDANTTGSTNTAIGASALSTETQGSKSTAVGYGTLATQNFTSATDSHNTAIGYNAGTSTTTAAGNTLIGSQAGDALTDGSANVAIGKGAMSADTRGQNGVAIGRDALLNQNFTSSTDSYNVAIGRSAGQEITTATQNTIVGALAGDALTTGGGNTLIGYEAGTASQDGAQTAIGYRAAYSATSGVRNVALGDQSLRGLTTANDCIGIGTQSFYATCTGSANIGLGYRSFFGCTSGHSNVGVGYQTLNDLSTADESVAIGYRALPHVTISDSNIGIGAKTGDGVRGVGLTTGTANILIGRETDTAAADNNYSIVMGVHAVGKGSNTGFISPNDGAVYQGNNSSSWSTTSDRRIKKNIVDNKVGLDAINQVEVKNFEYRKEDEITELPTHAAINKEGVQLGVIAQELQTVLPDMVNEETTGCLSVNPDNMVWYLVNAVKELSAKNDALEARLKKLEEK